MRVPLSDFIRALPEFDDFDDEACRRIVTRARRSRNSAAVARGLLCFLPLAVFTLFLSAPVIVLIIDCVDVYLRSTERSIGSQVCSVAILLIAGLVPALLLMMLADAIARARLIKELTRTTCVGCGYSLLGLPTADDRVRCPECGEVLHLSDVSLATAAVFRDPDRGHARGCAEDAGILPAGKADPPSDAPRSPLAPPSPARPSTNPA